MKKIFYELTRRLFSTFVKKIISNFKLNISPIGKASLKTIEWKQNPILKQQTDLVIVVVGEYYIDQWDGGVNAVALVKHNERIFSDTVRKSEQQSEHGVHLAVADEILAVWISALVKEFYVNL